MPTAYLNIGSNQGDRRALIERAVALITYAYPTATVRVSDYIETEPWGYESANPYLNLGIAIDMDSEPDPMSMLDTMQAIEHTLSSSPHRNADGSYRDREIDIDIIAIDGVRIDTPRLTLPHPRAAQREFVIKPLVQLTGSSATVIMQELMHKS